MALTEDEILEEVLVSPRHAFTRLPEMRVIERPGWNQIITPSFKAGGLNGVAFCALPPEEVDAAIDEAIGTYRTEGLRFRFNVGPDSAPSDLGDRLRSRGLTMTRSLGMARETSSREAPASARLATNVRVVDASLAEPFADVMEEGWGIDRAPQVAYIRALLGEPERNRLFIAYVEGKPAAVASYVAFARSAYFIGGVVLPQFRTRGVYHALVNARLADASARHIPIATTHAMVETSAPILERMGFRTVCELAVYSG